MEEKNFRRITGVKEEPFKKMVEIVEIAHQTKKARVVRKNKLSVEEMVLITLEYEYRIYFHIGKNRGISESYAYKIIKCVENVLIKDGTFSLPGRKSLQKSDIKYEVILIDAAETPIELPKKK